MKHIYLVLLLTLGLPWANSSSITLEKAINTASNFVYGFETPIKDSSTYGQIEEAKLYIINFSPEGWALVSSNTEARPVVGYSTTGYFDVNDLNSNTKNWLDNQIDQIANRDIEKSWQHEWDALETGPLSMLKSTSVVEPLLTTKWNQDKGWNDLCPDYAAGPNGKAYVGCVAVAMAQALHHIKYPENPVGLKTYALAPYGTISTNFDAEAPYEWDKMSLSSADDYNRQLLYNCAVAVEMDFGGAGSGAYTTRVPFALKRYFQFDDNVVCVKRENYPVESDWTDILKEELLNGRVIVYAGDPGTGSAGHAFNIDGVAGSGYFHFNWGWSGSKNGYFSINNIAPGSYNFSSGQEAVIGIESPYNGPTDISLSNQKIAPNASARTEIGTVEITDNSDENNYIIEVLEQDFLSFKTSKNFIVENSVLKNLKTLTASSYSIIIKVTDTNESSFEKEFNITVTAAAAIGVADQKSFVVSPNPAKDILMINNIDKTCVIHLLDLSGKSHLSQKGITSKGINVSHINRGIYILQIIKKNGNTSVQRVILK